MPYIRDTDHAGLGGKEPIIKITREIGLPWILGVLGSVAAGGASLVFLLLSISDKQAEQGLKQTEIGAKVEAINDKLNRADVAGAKTESEVKFKIDDLSRRVTVIEAQQGRPAK